ncbi:hypothetical protein QRD89_03515 [Halobacillus sp. ACCC02827]|uniref:hypothetical protein n=1 Tax=unclassified Halobacillus TaxID=2636472 RepID=UPI0002A4E6D8|nr:MULTISPECIES: hypothetical protein [unclassified Halobacillus]ELK48055.1 hypothetical protein D479_04048 [Halobacillus sp. BAB-2008]WJE16436.1 hypothetical protein QRD89_03515 [Halobacillus sp. ACCC02827]
MRKRIVILTVFAALLVFAGCNVFGPYNLYYEWNEEGVLADYLEESDQFQSEDIDSINYLGSDTFEITTGDEDYIVKRVYTSMMNGHWDVFQASGSEADF